MSVNRAASIHARLLERAKRDGVDFNQMLARYALERWLWKLSISQARGEFMLKGALLFDLWFDVPHRPTRDADFLGLVQPMRRYWPGLSRWSVGSVSMMGCNSTRIA